MSTSESSRPSLQKKPQRKKTLPFHGVLQHVRNVDMMLECMECGMWRLLYSKKKLSQCDRKELEEALDEWDLIHVWSPAPGSRAFWSPSSRLCEGDVMR